MQFGHNDNGKMFEGNRPRASIKGNGDETEEGVVEMTGEVEVVHSYGWYLRRYIADAKAKGATPIVLSLVPRDRWKDGRVIRSDRDYAKWAAQAARDGGALFVNLNEIAARRYEAMGEDRVGRELFTETDWTHTTKAGAEVNAGCVVDGIRTLRRCPLADFLKQPEPTPEGSSELRFDFGDAGRLASGFRAVTPSVAYTRESGVGFEPGEQVHGIALPNDDPLTSDACESNEPFYFSVALPEGNYRVRIVGRRDPLTVKAELRRLMVLNREPDADGLVRCEFTVNTRTPRLASGKKVGLKPREMNKERWAWDKKLTLEFNGPRPCVSSLCITPEPDAVTVFLAGDSTVCDQPGEPWNSWGQMLPLFFKPGVAVANHAESGMTLRGSWASRRFEKIFELMKPGDYLLIQFGHNDMKDKSPDALTKYRAKLKEVVKRTQDLGGHPVLVTPMERKAGRDAPTLGEYPQTVREVAAEDGVPLVDLNAMSRELYAALGDEVGKAFQDGTHHNTYGSYLLAKCVVRGILDNDLGLADHVVDGISGFDPSEPDSVESVSIPPSPQHSDTTPAGS